MKKLSSQGSNRMSKTSSGSSGGRKKAIKQGAMYGVLGVPVKTVEQRKKIAGGMSGAILGSGIVGKKKKTGTLNKKMKRR